MSIPQKYSCRFLVLLSFYQWLQWTSNFPFRLDITIIFLSLSYVLRYRQPVQQHSAEQQREAEAMLARVDRVNRLKERVESHPELGDRARWTPMDGDAIQDFPRLNEEYLRQYTFGVYQVKQAKNYADEHLKQGTYEVHFNIYMLQYCNDLSHCGLLLNHVREYGDASLFSLDNLE